MSKVRHKKRFLRIRRIQVSFTLKKILKIGEPLHISADWENIKFPPPPELPKLSVLIVHRNGIRFLLETLETIRKQNFKDFELIIIDGASTDGSLELLRKIDNIKLISEPDLGFDDAFIKGLDLASGKYVTHCCVSDGYLSDSWFKEGVEKLDLNPWASLVWAFPRTLNSRGLLEKTSYPILHFLKPPVGPNYYFYWTLFRENFPEGNYIVHKEVMRKCFPERSSKIHDYNLLPYDPLLQFVINFHKMGYLSVFSNSIANFGRIHTNSITESDINLKRNLYMAKMNRNQINEMLVEIIMNKQGKQFIDNYGSTVKAYKNYEMWGKGLFTLIKFSPFLMFRLLYRAIRKLI